jgi:hypothetical protein
MVVDAGTVDIAYAARARWLGREYASKSEWPSWPTFTWWGGPAYREIDERGLSLGVAYVAVVAGQEVRVYLVLWPYSFLLAGAGLWLLRSGVRAGRDAAGKCRDCAYDFTGLSGGAKCPECGRSRA